MPTPDSTIDLRNAGHVTVDDILDHGRHGYTTALVSSDQMRYFSRST